MFDAALRRLTSLQQGDRVGRPVAQTHHPGHVRAGDVATARRRHVAYLCTARLH